MNMTLRCLGSLGAALFLWSCGEPSLSTATLQIQHPDPNRIEETVQKLAAGWNQRIEVKRIRNTDLYQIRFSDGRPDQTSAAVHQAVRDLEEQITTAFPDATIQRWETPR
ncbi:MAG: hypothetical protein SNJ84_08555 [Verrucomicrobiia bacterium]